MSNVYCNECEIVDCDCDWYEIYSSHSDFKEFCGDIPRLQPYRNWVYYQCWGGGPEGGFIINQADGRICKVNRGWGEPFSVEPVEGRLEIAMRFLIRHLRIVKN